LNSGVRDAEMQNTEYADFNWEKCTLHVQAKPWRAGTDQGTTASAAEGNTGHVSPSGLRAVVV
jgi:hypothetical protein